MSTEENAPFFPKSTGAGTTVTVRFDENDDSLPRFAIGYWSIRGLGAPLRMMLCAAKCSHTVFLYDLEEKKEEDGGGWTSAYFAEKPALIEKYKCPLMNLPYIVDRDHERVVAQTNACLSYLARHVGMWGSDEEEISQCEELLCEIYDLRCVMTQYAYGSGNTSVRDAEAAVKRASKHFQKLEMHLKFQAEETKEHSTQDESNNAKVHLVGGKFTAPDFHLFEMLDQFDGLCAYFKLPDCLQDFPRLREFKSGFEKLNENQFYLRSWMHTGLPNNNKMAVFGSAPGPETYKRGETKATWTGRGDMILTSSM